MRTQCPGHCVLLHASQCCFSSCFFFFNDPATTEIYTSFPTRRSSDLWPNCPSRPVRACLPSQRSLSRPDRKSTRLNSSHGYISYAVFCLKKKHDETLPLLGTDTIGSHLWSPLAVYTR